MIVVAEMPAVESGQRGSLKTGSATGMLSTRGGKAARSMSAESSRPGDVSWLSAVCDTVEGIMAELRTSDLAHGGLNEAGFKGLVIAGLHAQHTAAGAAGASKTVSLRSEQPVGRGFADLVVARHGHLVVAELKYVPAGFAGTTDVKQRSALVQRDAVQRQVEWLKSLTTRELEVLRVSTGNGVIRSVAELCTDALSQASRYAFGLAALRACGQPRKEEAPTGAVRAVAIVGIGPRVLLRTADRR